MIEIRVRADVASLRFLDGRAVQFAEAQAINRTAGNVQKEAVSVVAEKMGVPRSRIYKRGKRAKGANKFGTVSRGRRANARRLETTITGYGRPFNVSRWNAHKVAGGVKHAAYGREQIAPGTWKIPSGAVVVRKGQSFRGVWGPGIGQVMEETSTTLHLTRFAQAKFDGHFDSALKFAFSGQARSRRLIG